MKKYVMEVNLPVEVSTEEAEKLKVHLQEYLRKQNDKINVKLITVITNDKRTLMFQLPLNTNIHNLNLEVNQKL